MSSEPAVLSRLSCTERVQQAEPALFTHQCLSVMKVTELVTRIAHGTLNASVCAVPLLSRPSPQYTRPLVSRTCFGRPSQEFRVSVSPWSHANAGPPLPWVWHLVQPALRHGVACCRTPRKQHIERPCNLPWATVTCNGYMATVIWHGYTSRRVSRTVRILGKRQGQRMSVCRTKACPRHGAAHKAPRGGGEVTRGAAHKARRLA